MLELALSSSERAALLRALRSSHRMRVRVDVLNRDEKRIASLTVPASRMLDGGVDVDAHADITRALSMTFLDPKHRLNFDADSPSRTALFADNMLAVRRGVLVEELDRWVDIPVFWGPVTDFERDRAEVKIEAMGKEALALDPHFVTQGYTLRKGTRVDTAIRRVMDRLGENRYDLPRMRSRLPRARAVQPEDEPWDVVKFGWEAEIVRRRGKGKKRRRERVSVEYNGLASLAGNFYVYYDGRGRLTAKRRNRNAVLTIREGVDLGTTPIITWDSLVARNRVVVTGAKVTKGKKPKAGEKDKRRQVQMRATATLQASHPLSPRKLSRNGRPRYMTEFVTVENLKTNAACRGRARRILEEKSRDGLELAFECLPFPFLEELDRVRVVTDDYALVIPLQRFTIPLTSSGLMSIGWAR